MYRYFYRFRLLPCHLCFFSFFIFVVWGGVCFSCGFLVSVLWMVFGPFLAPFLVSPFVSFRLSPRFLVPFFAPPFGSLHRFVSPFGRVGRWFVGRAVFVSSLGLAGVYFSFVLRCRGGDV